MFKSDFIQIIIGGDHLAGTADTDVWQIGFKVPVTAQENLVNDADMTTLLNDVFADAETWFTSLASNFGAQTRFSFVKVNQVKKTGLYLNETKTYRKDRPTPIAGSATVSLPADVALVVTLNTDAARGLASKGRVYLPALATSAIAGGRVLPSARDNVGTQTALLVKNLSNAPGFDVAVGYTQVAVMSEVGEGTTRSVTSVRVGDLFDTQQRRSNKMREAYKTFPLPA
jgi:hypothetical protein